MAASNTLPEVRPLLNFESIVPRGGVVTLSGFGISAQVERGHLVLRDGVCDKRREGRFSRINHGLRRVVVIGSDGMISLAALRWIHDQKAAFVMVERNGRCLTTAGPVGPKAVSLKRMQVDAVHSGASIGIARTILDRKLGAQAALARQRLKAHHVANAIEAERSALSGINRVDALRWAEARAALAYWSAWRDLAIAFPTHSLARVPVHWRVFGARRSPLTGSGRLAVNPPNAMLNYLYAVLESESSDSIAKQLSPQPQIGSIENLGPVL
ncbi:MAG TPA: CRISPR-associated endonuclease Cas1 [Vicinamibacterales bacterium]|nr:CRISPR-associated endonuclease Cas1 [Vicinamibacterales bacterium]